MPGASAALEGPPNKWSAQGSDLTASETPKCGLGDASVQRPGRLHHCDPFTSMLRHRVLSAAVLIPLVLGLAYLGGIWFLGLVLVVLMLAGHEYVSLLRRGGESPSQILVLTTIGLLVLDAYSPQTELLRPSLSVLVLGTLAWAVVRYERGRAGAVADWAWTAAGGLYLGWTGAHFVLLRNIGLQPRELGLAPVQGDGLWWLVLALSATWLTDTGAYFVGRAYGRHKMAPKVSPHKSWEGLGAGIVLGTVGGAVVAVLIRAIAAAWGQTVHFGVWDGLALGALISVLSPLGDLGESLVKRHVGAKDSSLLLPGHGGMFDRIDSLLWAAVIAYYYATRIAGA
jgi:phosphatidate cytidylyltransferase